MMQRTEYSINRGLVDRASDFLKEIRDPEQSGGRRGLQRVKAIFDKYRIEANGTTSNPGYVCLIRQGNFVRFGTSRRPRKKIIKFRGRTNNQELIWYGYTGNMLNAKQEAMNYFSKHRAIGDWYRITPLMAITCLKRMTD
jgi:hypothetical protein